MGEQTGISWTDSTMNWWEGCTKVGPGCDHCYAATRDFRYNNKAGITHWGAGAPRRQMSQHTRNNMMRWQRQAPEFFAEHGRRRRVFCSSLSDIFDNEVPQDWRDEAFTAMELAPDLLVQICTKRLPNVIRMVPSWWKDWAWPKNVGLLATAVTVEEVRRELPRLVALKREFGIPWVGLSLEPLIEDVHVVLEEFFDAGLKVDWIIIGGESGADARPFDIGWAVRAVHSASRYNVAAFVKQLGARPMLGIDPLRLKDPSGADPSEWPIVPHRLLHRQDFPEALQR